MVVWERKGRSEMEDFIYKLTGGVTQIGGADDAGDMQCLKMSIWTHILLSIPDLRVNGVVQIYQVQQGMLPQ